MPPTIATSLKLPAELKAAIDEDAKKLGMSTHAYMVKTLADSAEHSRLRDRFTQDALEAERDMLERGGCDWEDVKAYLAARRRGEKPERPPLRPVPR
jgi:predicted transcriptional regulator